MMNKRALPVAEEASLWIGINYCFRLCEDKDWNNKFDARDLLDNGEEE